MSHQYLVMAYTIECLIFLNDFYVTRNDYID